MGIVVIGELYKPHFHGIPWSQPNGPGTNVFPAQENQPWTNYPVPGQFFSESSGLFQVGCGHSVDLPFIFQDWDGFVITIFQLKDSNGVVWELGATNNGLIQTIPTPYTLPLSALPLLMRDQAISQTWEVGVMTNGDLTLTPNSSGGVAYNQILLASVGEDVFALQVYDGLFQTLGKSANSGSPLAIVACPMCSYVQYCIPIAQYYDLSSNSATPLTLI